MRFTHRITPGRKVRKALWIYCLLFSLFLGSASYGQQYEVEGKVSTSQFNKDGSPRPDWAYACDFTVSVSNSIWEMILKPSAETREYFRKFTERTGRPFDLPDYNRMTFDGTDLYSFNDWETVYGKFSEKRRADGNPIPPRQDNRAGADIMEREVPHQVEGDGAVWLACASAYNLKSATTNLLEVAWRWGLQLRGPLPPNASIRRRATWELGDAAPHLPKRVTYFYPFGNRTNALFTVQAYKNFEGLILPVEATLEVYWDPTNHSAPNVLLARYEVKATAFREMKKKLVFPPPVPVLTIVADHRFNKRTDPVPDYPVPYDVSDRFLTKEEARHSENYTNFKLNQAALPPEVRDYNQTKMYIVVLLASVSVIFLAILLRNMQSNQKLQEDKN